jgi:homogentisate 1,2-dioxygenase
MNERIDKLIEECTDRHFSDCVGGFETFDKEKFAELIVKECAELVKDQLKVIPADQKDWDGHNYGYTAAVYETLDRLEEHFGVKE